MREKMIIIITLLFSLCFTNEIGASTMYVDCYIDELSSSYTGDTSTNINFSNYLWRGKFTGKDGNPMFMYWWKKDNILAGARNSCFFDNCFTSINYMERSDGAEKGAYEYYHNEGYLCWYKDTSRLGEWCRKEHESELYDHNEAAENLEKGYCPRLIGESSLSQDKNRGDFLHFAGLIEKNNEIAELQKSSFIIYEIEREEGNGEIKKYKFIEGYDANDGRYFYATDANGKSDHSFGELSYVRQGPEGSEGINHDGIVTRDHELYASVYYNGAWIGVAGASQIARVFYQQTLANNENAAKEYFNITSDFENYKYYTMWGVFAVWPEDSDGYPIKYHEDVGFNLIYDSSIKGQEDSRSLGNYVKNEFLNDEELKETMLKQSESYTILEDNYKSLNESAKEINDLEDKSTFKFKSGYSAKQMFNDLKEIKESKLLDSLSTDISYVVHETPCADARTALLYKFYYDKLGVRISAEELKTATLEETQIRESLEDFWNPKGEFKANDNNSGFVLNQQKLNDVVISYLASALEDIPGTKELNILTLPDKVKELITSYAMAIQYLNQYKLDEVGVSKEEMKDIRNYFTKFVEENYNLEVALDCDSLFDDKLKDKIGEYSKIIKISIPIILILFGVIDFTRALFAGDDDKMKKAQKDFIIRIAIAVLFFLTPTIINLILELANKVWSFISPGTCNIEMM